MDAGSVAGMVDGTGATPQLPPTAVAAATSPEGAAKTAVVEGLPTVAGETPEAMSTWSILWGVLTGGLSYAAFVKAMCMAGNVIVQVSPFPDLRRWERVGHTENDDSAPYVAIAFAGWQWCLYGLGAWLSTGNRGFLILFESNILGAVLGTYYCIQYWTWCKSASAVDSLYQYLSSLTALGLLQLSAVGVLPVDRSLFLIGLVSAFCGFVGALSMLVTVPEVIRKKDSSSIPGIIALANLFCGVAWLLCGWILEDIMITAPSWANIWATLICLYLKHLYPEDRRKDGPSWFTFFRSSSGSLDTLTPGLALESGARIDGGISSSSFEGAEWSTRPVESASSDGNRSTFSTSSSSSSSSASATVASAASTAAGSAAPAASGPTQVEAEFAHCVREPLNTALRSLENTLAHCRPTAELMADGTGGT